MKTGDPGTNVSTVIASDQDVTSHPKVAAPKWHLVYYLLATFNLLTICLTLYLSFQIMAIYTQSVDVNKEWSTRDNRYSNLGQLAMQVNAPGNDVFDSRDVAGESAKLRTALHAFTAAMTEAHHDLTEVAEPHIPQLSEWLDTVDEAMDAMVAEAQQIFTYFDLNQPDLAGQRMATMDRKYAQVTVSLAQLRAGMSKIQQDNFSAQLASAAVLKRYEYLVAGIIVLIIIIAVLYGHYLAKKIRLVHNDRERALAQLQETNLRVEGYVTERTHQVERLLKQKDEFIHQLGHDLRTPLTPLVTLLPIARSLEKDPEIQEFLDVTIESTGYMKDMVDKLLLLAKLNSDHTPIDITDVILQEEVVKSLASSEVCLAQNDNITLENKINKDIIVQADTTYLITAFNNLLSNAMKYSPEGGTLTIDAIKNNGWVTVSIRDEGVGLTEEQQAKMFDEFYKGDSARHDLKSLGPGLAICKRIIERHGGNIWAESPGLGMGTKIYFTLKSGE